MSVNVTFCCTNKPETETLLQSILDGTFQAHAHKRIPEIFEELEKYPSITDEEVYMPKFNTPEARRDIALRLEKRQNLLTELRRHAWIPDEIDRLNNLRNTPESEDFNDQINTLIDTVSDLNSASFYSPYWEVQIFVDLLFKHAGFKPDTTEDLEKVSFSTWTQVFNTLNRDVLSKIKEEIDANPEEYETFEYFVGIIKEIRDIHRACDGINTHFLVSVEGGEDTPRDLALADTIKTFLLYNEIAPIDLQGKSINIFGD